MTRLILCFSSGIMYHCFSLLNQVYIIISYYLGAVTLHFL
jgi:hypothetical protein